MINTSNDPAAIAKAQVDTWFGQHNLGQVFIARDKRVFRLGPGELERLRDDAEAEVTKLQLQMRFRVYLAIGLVVAAFIGFQIMANSFAPPLDKIIENAGYAIYSAHGFWIFYEAYLYEAKVKAVRDAIATSMAGRVPLPNGLTEQMTRANPFKIAMVVITLGLVALYLAAETLAHRGFDLISAIPMWAYFGIVPLTWGLYLLAHFLDRKRGVGS